MVIDFKGQVQFQSFKKIVDFCYLDDLNVLNSITDSTEMIEIIKLSNQYKLTSLLKAAESYFQEHMVSWLDSSSTCLTLKLQPEHKSERKKKTSSSGGDSGAAGGNKDQVATTNNTNNNNGRGQQVSQSSKKNGANGNGQGGGGSVSTGVNSSASLSNTGQSTQATANYSRKSTQKSGAISCPQGLMFLPDGKALIMDNELYR